MPPSSILRVSGDRIVDGNGTPVILRGAGLGGWMNMENFISGFPGHEAAHRDAMRRVLGDNYEFFFDTFLEYFFTDKDAELFVSLGLNCLRLPFNYRHFEDDMNPFVFKESGFKHLDRVINICAAHGIYTILDLHSAPGCQNVDWHSDNPSSQALFWEHVHFQDRAVELWREIAKRYAGNPLVAGYNPLNEPTDEQHVRLIAWYERVEKAIRQVDPDHILFLDGNTFAMDFSRFERILPNCVYACHDYSNFGFPSGPKYTGSQEDKDKIVGDFKRKTKFMRDRNLPIWNGEWGPVYSSPPEQNWEDTNNIRLQVVKEQLRNYERVQCGWSLWTWKDIGYQGMVYTSPTSKWNTLLAPFLAKKELLAVDFWGVDSSHLDPLFEPLESWIRDNVPAVETKYPKHWKVKKHLARAVRYTLLADALQDEFADLFKGKSRVELAEILASWKVENCLGRQGLLNVIRQGSEI